MEDQTGRREGIVLIRLRFGEATASHGASNVITATMAGIAESHRGKGRDETPKQDTLCAPMSDRQDEISDLPKQGKPTRGKSFYPFIFIRSFHLRPAEILHSPAVTAQRKARWLPFMPANV
jgi:hypothetical protein